MMKSQWYDGSSSSKHKDEVYQEKQTIPNN